MAPTRQSRQQTQDTWGGYGDVYLTSAVAVPPEAIALYKDLFNRNGTPRSSPRVGFEVVESESSLVLAAGGLGSFEHDRNLTVIVLDNLN